MTMSRRRSMLETPPYRTAGLVVLVVAAIILAFGWIQFRGGFTSRENLTVVAARAGLSMDPGSKVTYNGVEIGQVGKVDAVIVDGEPRAKITLDVDREYLKLIPKNVDAKISATTVFGNKYISLSSP
jgi:phospholipid/cholesterol/gamma-HCH transport system substrate-binding protein